MNIFRPRLESIYPLRRNDSLKCPDGDYPRERVAQYLSSRVVAVDELLRDWCVYVAQLCPYIEWDGDLAYMPEEWCDVEKFALEWKPEIAKQVAKAREVKVFAPEPLAYCGKVTVCPEGDVIVKLGDRVYYKAWEDHPFSLAFAQRYMKDLEENSFMIHPMELTEGAGIRDHGWMFKRKRMQVARELMGAIKKNTDLPIYIPGDGVGFFSLAARELGMPYFSSEPAECGTLAVEMRLISVRAGYAPEHGTGMVTMASQLMPFVPAILRHDGPRVIFDQQRWYSDHPKDLKLLPCTGHRVCYTGDLLKGYSPLLLLEKGFSRNELAYIAAKIDDYDGRLQVEDKALISKCMLAGLPFASKAYGRYGPEGWIREVEDQFDYLVIGKGPGLVDPETAADVNLIGHVEQGPKAIMYGSEGMRVYSPFHGAHAVPFSQLMTWHSPADYYELTGACRQRVKFRARMWPMPGGEQLAIRTRGATETIIAVQYGRGLFSAEVDERRRVYVAGWYISPVKLQTRIANAAEIPKSRSIPSHVVKNQMMLENWFSEYEYRNQAYSVFDLHLRVKHG